MEVFSPVSLPRQFEQVNRHNPVVFTEMQATDFYNYHDADKQFDFVVVPFTKVNHLKLTATQPLHVAYRTSFDGDWNNVKIVRVS